MADKVINGSLKTTGLINSGYPVKKETIEYVDLGNGTSYLNGLDDSVFNENIISGVAKSYDTYMQAQYFDVSFNFVSSSNLWSIFPVEGVNTIVYLQHSSYDGYKYQFNYDDMIITWGVISSTNIASDTLVVTTRPGIDLDGDIVINVTVVATKETRSTASLNLRIYVNECIIHTVPVPLIYGSVARTVLSSRTTEPLVHYQSNFAPSSDTQRTYSIDIANVSAFRDCILEIESEGSSYTDQEKQLMGLSDFGTGEITSMTYSITNHILHVNITVTYTAGYNRSNIVVGTSRSIYVIDLVPRIHIKYVPYPSVGYTFLNNKITNSDIILSDINQFTFDPTNGSSINSSDKRIEGTLYTSGLLNNGRTIKKLQFTSSDQILDAINDIPAGTILAYSSGTGSCGNVSQQVVTISDSFESGTTGGSGQTVTALRTLTYELATIPSNATLTTTGDVTCTFNNISSTMISNISLQSYNFSVSNNNKLILTLEISVTYRTLIIAYTVSYDVNANVPEIELTNDFLTPLDLYEHHRDKETFTSVESSITFSASGSGTAATATRAYSYTINNVGSTINIDDITINFSGTGSVTTTYQILTNDISYDMSNHSLDVYINVRITGRRWQSVTPSVNINYYPWPLNEIQLLVPGTNNKISSGYPVTCFYCGPYAGNLGN